MISLNGLVILCAALACCTGTLVKKGNLKPTMQCGTMSNSKTTILENPVTLPKRCVYGFTRYSPDVTQVRIEMKELQLMQPQEQMGQPDQRQCVDRLVVNGMVLCGNNDGQHVYVQFGSDQYLNVVFDLPLGDSVTKWKLNVTQLESSGTTSKKQNKPFLPLRNGLLANGLQNLKNVFSMQPKDNNQFLRVQNGPLGSGPLGNGPFGNGPVGNAPFANGAMGNGPPGIASLANGQPGNGPFGNGPLGSGPLGSGPLGNGPLGMAPQANGPFGNGPLPSAPLGMGSLPNGPLANGPLANGPFGNGPLPSAPLANGLAPNGPLANGPLANGPLANGPLGNNDPRANGQLGNGQLVNGLRTNGPLANALQHLKRPVPINDAMALAPAGCTQYFTDRTGTVESFNYNGGAGPYMSNQSYTICFKQFPESTRVELDFVDFGMPNEGTNLGFDLDCHAAIPTLGRQEDYLAIPGASATVNEAEIHPTYFCGTTTSGKTVTFGSLGPFVMYFVSDGLVSANDKGFKINYKII